jgi:hypothetical protein
MLGRLKNHIQVYKILRHGVILLQDISKRFELMSSSDFEHRVRRCNKQLSERRNGLALFGFVWKGTYHEIYN